MGGSYFGQLGFGWYSQEVSGNIVLVAEAGAFVVEGQDVELVAPVVVDVGSLLARPRGRVVVVGRAALRLPALHLGARGTVTPPKPVRGRARVVLAGVRAGGSMHVEEADDLDLEALHTLGAL